MRQSSRGQRRGARRGGGAPARGTRRRRGPGEEANVADFDEAVRQDVEMEAADELGRG
jgi:hypothetical protein